MCVYLFAYILCLSSEISYHPRLERKRPCILIIVFISFGCSSVSTLTYTFNIVACHTFFALQSFFFFYIIITFCCSRQKYKNVQNARENNMRDFCRPLSLTALCFYLTIFLLVSCLYCYYYFFDSANGQKVH